MIVNTEGEINFWWGGNKNWWWGSLLGRIFPGGGDELILGWWRGGTPPVGKTLDLPFIVCMIFFDGFCR